MNKIHLGFISILLIIFSVTGCGSSETSSLSDENTKLILTGISTDINDAVINVGDDITITVYKNYDDGSVVPFDSADSISWAVDFSVIWPNNVLDKSVESFSAKNTRGVTDVEVTYIDSETNIIHKNQTTVTVNPVYLRTDILPDSLLIPPDFFFRFQAIERYNDGIDTDITDVVTWDVLDSTIGNINVSGISSGFVSLNPGITQVTATYNSESVSVPVEVVPTRVIGAQGQVFPSPNSLMHNASVVIDGSNNATAVYGYQVSGELMSAGHDGTDWTPTVQINASQKPTDTIAAERIATNDAGARFVTWEGLNGLYAAYAKSGEGFGPTMTIPVTDSVIIEIVVTDTNEVIIYYLAWDGASKIMSSRFDPVAVIWSTPQKLDWSSYPEILYDTPNRLAFNSNGDAILYWELSSAESWKNYVAIYINSAGLDGGVQAPRLIYSTSDIFKPVWDFDLTINDKRDAVVAWSVGSNYTRLTYALNYTNIDGWGTTTSLPMGNGMDAITIKTAMNETGTTLVGWVSQGIVQGIGGSSLHINRYTSIDGWTAAEEITTNQVQGTLRLYALTVLDDGNAICIYDGRSFVPTPHAYRRYIDGIGWQNETVLDHIGIIGNTNDSLKVSYNKQGKGIITWTEGNWLPFPDGSLSLVDYNFLELAPSVK